MELLNDAVGGGYLDLKEFDERSQVVLAAKTRADLFAALSDLPTAARLFPPAAELTASSTADSIEISWITVKRQGIWDVPARLVITGSAGTADLDLREARIPAHCVIEILTTWSTVKLKVGNDVVLRTGGYGAGTWSSLKDKAGAPTVPGGPQISINGAGSYCTLVLRRA